MVTVIFHRDSRQRLFSVFGSGHVQIAETANEEYSLVCAAVSAVLQAARLGLQAYAGVALDVVQEKGGLRLVVPEDRRGDESVKAILATAELSVEQIAKQFPQHVSLQNEVMT